MKIKNISMGLSLLGLTIMPLCLMAQESSDAKVATPIQELNQVLMDNILFLIAAMVILLAFFILFQTLFALLEVQKRQAYREIGLEWPKPKQLKAKRKPLWKRLNDWAWKIVPVSREDEIDMGHEYDGIRELDNRLPPWWLGLMYGSIIFAGVYMYYYHWSGSDWSSAKEYQMAMAEAEDQKQEYLRKAANAVDENTVVALTDEASLESGKALYITKCASCHGQLGEGGIGPNLTDEYWLHGGDVKDIFSTIKYGVPEKGMIAWKKQLRPSDIHKLSSFILSMQGTNPPNGKEKEGEYFKPETTLGQMDNSQNLSTEG